MVLDLKVVGVLIRLLRKLIVVSAQPISIDVSNIRTFTKKLSVLLSFMMFKNPIIFRSIQHKSPTAIW